MKEKKIRIGHVGTLHDHSIGKLRSVHKLSDTFDVVGIVVEDEERREQLRREYPYSLYPFISEDELLNRGCDAVMVEGFEYELPHTAMRFIQNGIPVHIDKPAGRDIDVFESALRIAKLKKVPVQMAYMYRYNPAVQKCLEMISQGQLGDILSVTAIMNTGHPPEKQQWLHNFKGGIMFFLGCHMLDLIYRIQGIPLSITPFLKEACIDGVCTENQATAVLEYKHGISIAQANSCEINGYGRRQLVVSGSKGTFEIRPLERIPRAFYTGIDEAVPFEDKRTELTFSPVTDQKLDAAGWSMFVSTDALEIRIIFKICEGQSVPEIQKLVFAGCFRDRSIDAVN